MDLLKVLVGAALLSVTQGCAFTTWYAPLEPVAVRGPSLGESRVCLGVVADRRERVRVGVKKNSFGVVTADVWAMTDVVWILRESLQAGLSSSSRCADGAPPAGAWRIEAELVRWLAEPAAKFFSAAVHGEAAIRLQVTAPDGAVYHREFVGHGVMSTRVLNELDFEIALRAALRDALEAALVELAGLVTGRTQVAAADGAR